MILRRFKFTICTLASLTACQGSDSTTPKPVPVASVTLTAPVSAIKATRSLAIQAKALDAAGNSLDGRVFSWNTDNTAVATVDQTGVVRGVSAGPAIITATSEGKVGVFGIVVTRAPFATITVSIIPGEVVVGKPAKVQAVVTDSVGLVVTDAVVKWRSTDPTIARVDSLSGVLTPIVAGTARIEASAEVITGSSPITVLPQPPIRFKSISAQNVFSCGLSTAGDAFCWGRNELGSLGSGNPPATNDTCTDGTRCASSPLAVAGAHVFTSLNDGTSSHICALAADGAYCWGLGASGEIGAGPPQSGVANVVPTKVQSSATYASLSVGEDVTCGLTTSHTIDCWGSNANGEIGDPGVTETCPTHVTGITPIVCSSTPHRVVSTVAFNKLSVGTTHVCALSEDGTAYCWGSNMRGYLGSASTSECGGLPCNKTPTPVATDLRFTDISVGSAITCAVGVDTRTYCWGLNTTGALGIGVFSDGVSSPVPVNTNLSFVKIFGGNARACGLDASGAAFCWGTNTEGEIGDGTKVNRATPTPVGQGLKFTSLSLAYFHSCGIATDGFAYCWGNNTNKELGIGNDGPALIPTRVAGQ